MTKSDRMDRKEALARAEALCSRRECCISQVEEKLRLWEVGEEDRDAIIAHLIEERYIDEARFCRAYALDKMRYNHWGRVKIDQMLRLLRVDAQARQTALWELPDEEYLAILRHVLQSKLPTVRARNDYERRAKILRFMASRGFETDLVLDEM